jgi:hypothetical protein
MLNTASFQLILTEAHLDQYTGRDNKYKTFKKAKNQVKFQWAITVKKNIKIK